METGHWDCKGLVVVGRGHIWDIVVESNLGCTTADMGIRPKSVVVTCTEEGIHHRHFSITQLYK